jgi:hypothetical protein
VEEIQAGSQGSEHISENARKLPWERPMLQRLQANEAEQVYGTRGDAAGLS